MAGVELTPGTVIGGDYRVLGPLAQGGMGCVYAAEQLSTGRRRAVKVMHPELVQDGMARERFAREATLGARIQSAHIVEVFGAGVCPTTGLPWLAMEHLEGEDLGSRVRRQGPLKHTEVLEIIEQLGECLGAIHRAGVVHRDIKPENLFLATARGGAGPRLKVLDLGIARPTLAFGSDGALTGALGSPRWMAPEQCHRGSPGPPADVWAFGMVAFYLWTGTSYWLAAQGEERLSELLLEVLAGPLEPASRRAEALGRGGRLPPGFDGWFARCAARDPSERFPDGASALEGLRAAVPAGAASQPAATTLELLAPPRVPMTAASAPWAAPAVSRRRVAALGAVVASAPLLLGVLGGVLYWNLDGSLANDRPRPARTAPARRSTVAPVPPRVAPLTPVPVPVPVPAPVPTRVLDPFPDHTERRWQGEGVDEGWRYDFVLTLRREGMTLSGSFLWTLRVAPERRMQRHVGESGEEYLRGTYDPEVTRVQVVGTRVTAPRIIATDRYRMTVSADGTLVGLIQTPRRDWHGTVRGRAL
ncbi:MAG: serine/threonine protein kinase [Deltaproteobacteria bacterium]|nr:serine/threonine protein kinase [Deltaproteobacteria bacterium]